jgi:hypothetical protein
VKTTEDRSIAVGVVFAIDLIDHVRAGIEHGAVSQTGFLPLERCEPASFSESELPLG